MKQAIGARSQKLGAKSQESKQFSRNGTKYSFIPCWGTLKTYICLFLPLLSPPAIEIPHLYGAELGKNSGIYRSGSEAKLLCSVCSVPA
jgi:hypothetical protein